MKTIEIKGKTYNYKYSLRALFIFERITGRPFALNDTMDTFTFFYAMLLANNEDLSNILTFDEFIDECDNDATIGNEMGDYLLSYFQNPLNKNDVEEGKEDDKSKKKSQRKS